LQIVRLWKRKLKIVVTVYRPIAGFLRIPRKCLRRDRVPSLLLTKQDDEWRKRPGRTSRSVFSAFCDALASEPGRPKHRRRASTGGFISNWLCEAFRSGLRWRALHFLELRSQNLPSWKERSGETSSLAGVALLSRMQCRQPFAQADTWLLDHVVAEYGR
jgi:hypothetical protein